MRRCQRGDLPPLLKKEPVTQHDHRSGFFLHHARKARIDFRGTCGQALDDANAQLGRRRLHIFHNPGVAWIAGVCQHRHAGKLGHHAAQQLQVFGADVADQVGLPGDVATRPRQALHQAGADRVGHKNHHDRNGGGGLARRGGAGRAVGDDHIRARRHQLGRQHRQAFVLALGPARIEHQVAAFFKALLAQGGAQRRHLGCERIGHGGAEVADAPDFSRLLRERGEWRCEGAGAQGDHQIAANVHSMIPVECAEEWLVRWVFACMKGQEYIMYINTVF